MKFFSYSEETLGKILNLLNAGRHLTTLEKAEIISLLQKGKEVSQETIETDKSE